MSGIKKPTTPFKTRPKGVFEGVRALLSVIYMIDPTVSKHNCVRFPLDVNSAYER